MTRLSQKRAIHENVTVSPARRLAAFAADRPDQPALVFASIDGQERSISWREFDERARAAAGLLQERGAAADGIVVVCLSNSPEHLYATFGAWILGACVLPLSPRLPPREMGQLLELAAPRAVVTDFADITYPRIAAAEIASGPPAGTAFPDVVPARGRAIASGGSTGLSKIILEPGPWGWRKQNTDSMWHTGGARADQVQLLAAPLYHNTPYWWSTFGLMDGHTVVVMERFDAARAVDLIERHRVQFAALVPTMMKRIADLPDIDARDLSSIESIFHTAAPCPPNVKRRWCELIPPERLHEGFGSTEAIGGTSIRGDEWLAHPGSVGRSSEGELRILDADRCEVAPEVVGEIFTRPFMDGPTYEYLGSPPLERTPDGFMSVGDMGRVDQDGYLYLADRRVDLIITGGANVYPAEVEAALHEHPAVLDVAVIGIPDADWGKRVHAVVQPRDASDPPTAEELDAHVRERLAAYKAPKGYEFVAQLPRNEAGKIRRSALAAERSS